MVLGHNSQLSNCDTTSLVITKISIETYHFHINVVACSFSCIWSLHGDHMINNDGVRRHEEDVQLARYLGKLHSLALKYL